MARIFDLCKRFVNLSVKQPLVLTALEDADFLTSQKIGKERIYLNKRLFDVVQEAGS